MQSDQIRALGLHAPLESTEPRVFYLGWKQGLSHLIWAPMLRPTFITLPAAHPARLRRFSVLADALLLRCGRTLILCCCAGRPRRPQAIISLVHRTRQQRLG
eukprot:COSAG01_NODE_3574_length_5919_cov_7.990550_3_plen_102_part_00